MQTFLLFVNYSEPHLDSAALHLDVASRHIKFQEELFVHASMTSQFFLKFCMALNNCKKKDRQGSYRSFKGSINN